jgi:hypothetical protein
MVSQRTASRERLPRSKRPSALIGNLESVLPTFKPVFASERADGATPS